MRRKRDEVEERTVEELFAELEEATPALPDDALRRLARSAAADERSPVPRRVRPHLRLRWAAIAIAVALLAGSAGGFGLGSSITPSGHATAQPVGLGFEPARRWWVMQSGTPTPSGTASAIAGNVPVDPSDRTGDIPYSTLASLPPQGVLIWVTFTARGDPVNDLDFPAAQLPLQVGAAEPVPPTDEVLPLQGVAQHRLRAAVADYNVDAQIFFGSRPPSADMLETAQAELNRLVVASERVTIFARPTTLAWGQSATIFGRIDSPKAGETVDIQVKECGGHFFRGVTAATTTEGGSWQGAIFPGITTAVRAVWNGFESQPITVYQRASVVLSYKTGREYRVAVGARAQFWRRHVLVQQRKGGSWKTVKKVVLTKTEGGGGFVWSSGYFTRTFGKGALIRAFFPLSQARPCLLAGVSNSLRARR